MKIHIKYLATLSCLLLAFVTSASATVPGIISYQGRLTDTGIAVDTIVDITVKLYTVPSGGTSLWQETHSSVQITDGLFTVLLGVVDMTGNPLPDSLFNNPDVYLGVQIGTSAEISPRTKMATVPYSFHSATADVASAVSGSQSDWFVGGDLSDLYNGGGRLSAYPPEEYEYGLNYIDHMIHRAVCTKWNLGLRFYNVDPYFVDSENPSTGMRWGGNIYYIETSASDDDAATPTNWRHGYWYIDHTSATSSIKIFASNGNMPTSVYCRKR